jgi:uncharacterized repeat protein (TIGR02543 family)
LSGSLTLPAGVTSIGSAAFENCSGLTGSLTLPAGLASIGSYAFSNCSGLTGSLTLPAGLTSIGSYAFQNCSGLSGSLTLPAGLTSIGSYAFSNCSRFTSVTNLSLTPQSINSNVFYNVSIGSIALQVPVASLVDYWIAQVWSDFGSIIGGATLRVAVNNPTWGSVTGAANGWLPANTVVNLIAAPAAGFDFEKWTSGGADLGVNPALTLTLTQDTAVTASFKPSSGVAVFTVTFNANGGSSVEPLPVVAGTVAVRPTDPTLSGHTFAGWYKEEALTTEWNFATDVVTADTTLYAKWTKVSCTVTFNSNGGSSVAPQTVAEDSTASQAPPPPPTRPPL